MNNERRFLVQRVAYPGTDYCTMANQVMTEYELIEYINFLDLYDEIFSVFEITDFGVVEKLTYQGWQPNCLIELTNSKGEVVVRGYGTDH